MISVISGIIVTGAGASGLWFAMPHNGQVQWFAKVPVLDSMIPTMIVAALALGVSLTISGFVD